MVEDEKEKKEDEELAAMKSMLDALTPLKPQARDNVIDYVFVGSG